MYRYPQAFNTNDHVWVKLTPRGWQLFDAYYTRLRMDPYTARLRLQDDAENAGTPGWQRFQLWELMHIFGPGMYNGAPEVPFERNVVYFEKPDT